MEAIRKFISTIHSILDLDIRDLFVFGGLGMLWYGLSLHSLPIAYSVCGVLLMLIGYIMRGK